MFRRPLTAFDSAAVVGTEHTDLVRALTCIAAGAQISAVLPRLTTSASHAGRSVGAIVTQCLPFGFDPNHTVQISEPLRERSKQICWDFV